MATAQLHTVVRHLRRAVLRQDAVGRTDGQLLASFIEQNDEAAFDTLIRRHGPMVFGVCCRIVRNHHDAEDAFQATFLVLARKASSVRPRERVANWLHGVALRTAMRVRTMTAKRRGLEKQVTEMPDPEVVQQDQWCDLQPLIDQELNGLPENYRLPILLCELEGKTIKEATRQLGWPQGTLAGRLARGRKMLAKRLTKRGVVLSAGSLATVVSQMAAAAVPTSLMSSTVKAAILIAAEQATVAGVVPAKVAALMEGVVKTMFVDKLKVVMGVLMMAACLIGIGTAVVLGQQPDSKADSEAKAAQAKPAAEKTMQERLQGTWKCVSMHCGGVKSQPDLICTIKGNTWESKLDGRVFQSGTFKLVDLDASPKQIDWIITFAEVEADRGKTCRGVFIHYAGAPVMPTNTHGPKDSSLKRATADVQGNSRGLIHRRNRQRQRRPPKRRSKNGFKEHGSACPCNSVA